jgi:hypothetical protein
LGRWENGLSNQEDDRGTRADGRCKKPNSNAVSPSRVSKEKRKVLPQLTAKEDAGSILDEKSV